MTNWLDCANIRGRMITSISNIPEMHKAFDELHMPPVELAYTVDGSTRPEKSSELMGQYPDFTVCDFVSDCARETDTSFNPQESGFVSSHFKQYPAKPTIMRLQTGPDSVSSRRCRASAASAFLSHSRASGLLTGWPSQPLSWIVASLRMALTVP
ncbi:hypothetical protein OFAG_02178 [Oxalobacter formigenes HOxBLS]|uniref:Uncharacterized protein n=1 Tax=Oxalobacter paraformigenes TaxID=556268 RepID=T5LPW1_9BURK|nr:hypothetical protein OFAG_02178 [Oxalobacter paraformigenes]